MCPTIETQRKTTVAQKQEIRQICRKITVNKTINGSLTTNYRSSLEINTYIFR
jgi:hypothetical protein